VDEALAQLRTAARTLADQGSPGASAADSLARDAAVATRLELVDLLLERASFTEDAAARRDLLLEARDALELSRTAELRDYFRDECLASERRVVAEQLPAALVVYPVVLPDRTELLVSRGDAIRSIRAPISGADLARDAHALRALLEKRTTRQYLPLAQAMYDRLIRPLEPLFTEPGVETLVFVPGGPLRTIPLGALHDRETGKFLIEKIPVAVVPGLSLVEPRPLDRERARVVQAGLSESVQGYLPLPAVEAELAAVHDAFGGTTLLNRAFLTAALEHEVESQPYGIVHIASHGEFHGDAADSFVLTWDGRLALERLADVVSVTRFREQPLELLALSACETAAGDERAALGLAGVAVRAGARSALATLWSIPDESAAEVVSEFYRQLAQPGTSRAQALQRAQVSVLSRVEYRHPGYWAPFLLISSWL
jgi:CHAT domain-containing protein